MSRLHHIANEIISPHLLLMNASMSPLTYTLIAQINKYVITMTLK